MMDDAHACATRRDALAFGIGAAAAVAMPTGPVAAASTDARLPLDTAAARILVHFPEAAVYNGVPAALQGGALARRMDDWSPAAIGDTHSTLRAQARSLALVARPQDRRAALQLAAARAILANGLGTIEIPYGRQNPLWFSGHVPYVIAPIAGPHIDTPNAMMAQQSLSSDEAVEAWIEKLDGFGRGFAAVREKLRFDEGAGCRAPSILLSKSLPAIDAFLAGRGEYHPMITTLREKMAAAGLSAPQRAVAERRAIQALDEQARPAFARLRETVAELARIGRSEAGVWAQPDGASLYAANVRALGDTSMSPADIHRLGLAESRRIIGQMNALLQAQGLTRGTVGARMMVLAQDFRFRYSGDDDGRAAALDAARQFIAAAEECYPRILPASLVPRARVEVRRVPGATEAGASLAFADPPSLDGVTPGIFWLNLRDMASVTRMNLPTTSFHEGVPGHFTAAAVAQRLGDQPMLLKLANFNAFNEGWALYAEQLMAEIGSYQDDPWGNLGRLNDELWRAVRLVVDTGIHHHRWARERAISFMAEMTGKPAPLVTSEIERYMAWPGQALGYKLGQLRLVAMRQALKIRLGARFTLPVFHDIVLSNGSLPLGLIEAELRSA